ncbi:MAG: thiosulfate oxidation carrier protein SoxY [Gammaproteobacteria bacterium]|nr:thiosulfate oxidation carrier protein SoxY [Gammaproteobacteria bacterium]
MLNHRRRFLKSLAALTGLLLAGTSTVLRAALAASGRNKPAFTSDEQSAAIEKLFPGQTLLPSDAIDIQVHDLVENGAVVPVEINTRMESAESITILVEKNPNPLIAHFRLGPRCQPRVATRIKVNEPSNITAVVKANGKLFSAVKFVEVIEGGCG